MGSKWNGIDDDGDDRVGDDGDDGGGDGDGGDDDSRGLPYLPRTRSVGDDIICKCACVSV